jgi:hypothetical protein
MMEMVFVSEKLELINCLTRLSSLSGADHTSMKKHDAERKIWQQRYVFASALWFTLLDW